MEQVRINGIFRKARLILMVGNAPGGKQPGWNLPGGIVRSPYSLAPQDLYVPGAYQMHSQKAQEVQQSCSTARVIVIIVNILFTLMRYNTILL